MKLRQELSITITRIADLYRAVQELHEATHAYREELRKLQVLMAHLDARISALEDEEPLRQQ